jgi:hypothetical protein
MMISLSEALAWIEARDQSAVDAWLNRPGSAFDNLFGLDLGAVFYADMAAETQSRARAELGWVSVEPEPVAALMSAIESEKLEVFGTRLGGALPELIPATAWGAHGLKLFGGDGDRYQGSSGIYAARSRQGPCVFIDLVVKQAALLKAFPAKRAKPRGRPPVIGERVRAEIEAMRAEGIDTRAMGEKLLAKHLEKRGVVAEPRTVGRINRGE